MSEFKTNKISPRSGTTQTIGDSGDSVSTSSGSTINNAGTITTAGITGGTINNTTGSIYLRGEVDWQPSDIKTASFTATDNQGFFVNTTSGEITVTLPASPSAGDVVGIKDYANTFDTNKCILNANGNKIQGSTTNFEIIVEGSSIIIIYVDATQGWVITDASKAADITEGPTYIVATGGTITCCGDYKIHTFTSPGTFTVCSVGNPLGGPNSVDYLVVAGGGAGGNTTGGGGGGAGGYRTSYPSPAGTVPISVQGYSITVGGGGTGAPFGSASSQGSSSIFSTITSTGGGRGAYANAVPGGAGTSASGGPGGSGGGGRYNTDAVGGSGNSPPVSPPQGNNGGSGSFIFYTGSGGGGASTTGNSGTPTSGGAGGAGSANLISGSSVTYAGGGGGGKYCQPGTGGAGGAGGGGAGNNTNFQLGIAGTANTGGGSGASDCGSSAGVNGGSGIVIIRYKYQ
jgi:hypothetical protein